LLFDKPVQKRTDRQVSIDRAHDGCCSFLWNAW